MADVFVSYGREDKERIKPIVDGLELLGVSAWHDERIKAGSQWDDEIETEIKQARAVIVCWSKASVVSRPVRAEALYARDHSKIVPCTLELCEIPLQLVYEQAEDLSGWTGAPAHAGWRKMLESIGKRIERPGLAALLDARATGEEKHLLSWAQQFPDDPHSPAVLAFIKKTEAQRFGSEMNSAREAIAGAVTLFDETKEKILQNCSAEFEQWIANLATTSYDERPRPVEALCAPGTSLDVAVLGKMASERDAAKADNKRLTVELEAAQAKIREAAARPTGFGRLGAALAGLVMGAAGGTAGFFMLGVGGSSSETTAKQAQQQIETIGKERDDGARKINALQEDLAREKTYASDLEAKNKRAESDLQSAEAKLNSVLSNSASSVETIRGQFSETSRELAANLKEKQKEIEALRSERDSLKSDRDAMTRAAKSYSEDEDKLRTAKNRIAELEGRVEALQTIVNAKNSAAPAPAPSSMAPTVAATESERISSCSLEIEGKSVISASPCTMGKAASGSEKILSISDPADARRYKATWRVKTTDSGAKIADAYLEGGKSSAVRSLGSLSPDPGNRHCWVNGNRTIKICATK